MTHLDGGHVDALNHIIHTQTQLLSFIIIAICSYFLSLSIVADYSSQITSPLRNISTASSDGSGSASSFGSTNSGLSLASTAPTSLGGFPEHITSSPEAFIVGEGDSGKLANGTGQYSSQEDYKLAAASAGNTAAATSYGITDSRYDPAVRRGRPLPSRTHSYVDFSSNLPPPVHAEALAPLALDSQYAQELEEEPPLRLPEPWAFERQRSNSQFGRLRRPSLSGPLHSNVNLNLGGAIGGFSTAGLPALPGASSTAGFLAERDDRFSLSRSINSKSRSRSRSPPARLASSLPHPPAPIFGVPHSVIPPDMPKSKFVEGLVGAACIAVEVVWKVPDMTGAVGGLRSSSSEGAAVAGGVLPLRHFIKEVLRRSRSTCSTLQTALYYIHKSRDHIRERVRSAEEAKVELLRMRATAQVDVASWNGYTLPSPPYGEHDHTSPGRTARLDSTMADSLINKIRDPVLCGRRMFLAALICASKFLQDRTYSNRAWAKISSLPVTEINNNEKAFLELLDYNLYVDSDLFRNCKSFHSPLSIRHPMLTSYAYTGTRRLQDLAEKQERKLSPTSVSSSQQRSIIGAHLAREGLARSLSEYPPAPETLGHVRASAPSSFHSSGALPLTPDGTPPLSESPISRQQPAWPSAAATVANLQSLQRAHTDSQLHRASLERRLPPLGNLARSNLAHSYSHELPEELQDGPSLSPQMMAAYPAHRSRLPSISTRMDSNITHLLPRPQLSSHHGAASRFGVTFPPSISV